MYAHYRLTVVTRTRYTPGPTYTTDRAIIAVPKTRVDLFDGLAGIEYDGESVEIRPTHTSSVDSDDTIYIVSSGWLDTLDVLRDPVDIYQHFRNLYARIAEAPDLKYTFLDDWCDEN